jgi:hypothetical protein
MKEIMILALILFFIPFLVGQEIIENPAKPLGKLAGRVVELVKIYDLKEGRIVRSFRREYKRIKAPEKVDEKKQPCVMMGGKVYTAPPQKFQNDIKNLLAHGDQILVMTSTADPKKGVLFDVFEVAGRYVDNFYLRFSRGLPDANFGFLQIELAGDHLNLIEKDENEIASIAKYKIKGNS